MKKTISVDENAYDLLNLKKQVLRENGMPYPTFSDAIRLACGTITVKSNPTIEDLRASLDKELEMKERLRQRGVDV
jgi:hypothetical protein